MENKELQSLIKSKLSTFYKVKGGNVLMQVKDVDTSKRTVEVVMNTLNFLDSDMDMLVTDCAKRSLKERGPDSNAVAKIKYCKDHDLNQSIGKWMDLSQREINYKGQKLTVLGGSVYLPETTKGNDQLIDYQSGVIDNHSIGFQYENIFAVEKETHGNSTQWDKYTSQMINPEVIGDAGYFFVVKEINWFEGSSVAFGANSLTPYLGVKSMGDKIGLKARLFDRIDLLGKQLKSGNQSDERMSVFELEQLQLKQYIAEMIDGVDLSQKERAIQKSKSEEFKISDVSKKFEFNL